MSERILHSRAGIASFVLSLAMVLVEVGVAVAVALGVKDNQGTVYAFFLPWFSMVICLLPCIILAMIGIAQRHRKRTFANIGLGLALLAVSPFLAAVFWGW